MRQRQAARFSDLCYTGLDLVVVHELLSEARVGVRTISEPSLPLVTELGGARFESQSTFDVDVTLASLMTSAFGTLVRRKNIPPMPVNGSA